MPTAIFAQQPAQKKTTKNKPTVIDGVEIPKKDNGYDAVWLKDLKVQKRRPITYRNKKELAKEITTRLGSKRCIKRLNLYGHGNDGWFRVGDGTSNIHEPCTYIDAKSKRRAYNWHKELESIANSFCDGGEIYLYGCWVGRGEEGAELLHDLATYFKAKVYAPVDKYHTGGNYRGRWQHANPSMTKPPDPKFRRVPPPRLRRD